MLSSGRELSVLSIAIFHESTALMREIVVDECFIKANLCCLIIPASNAKFVRALLVNAIHRSTDIGL